MNAKKWYLRWEREARRNGARPFIYINDEVINNALDHVVYMAHTLNFGINRINSYMCIRGDKLHPYTTNAKALSLTYLG